MRRPSISVLSFFTRFTHHIAINMAPSSTTSPLSPLLAAAAISLVMTTAALYARHKRSSALIIKLEENRLAERKGRIRAEMKLRSCLKNEGADTATQNGAAADTQKHNLQLHCIGTVVSPYTKRMGTPRQGALVPSGRGFIQLRIPVECVEGLEMYSHAWVLFTFHANTDTPNATSNSGDGSMMNLSKTKIRPPRAGNIKVGMLATRSPHRPNNIGLSLVQVDRVDEKNKRLYISAFDLVNGTPVYDVKPCVPWDIPGNHDNIPLSVPDWVSQDDALRTVDFTTKASDSLQRCIRRGKLAPLYTLKNDGMEGAMETIKEVLSQDPRASNTNSVNKRGSIDTAMKKETYKFVFCDVEIEFRVSDTGVKVENVSDLDLEGVQYVDGIPVLLNR